MDLNYPWPRDTRNWAVKLGYGWKAKKSLGRGSYGTVALWEYEGPAHLAPAIKQVVAKQCPISKFDAHKDLYVEGRILEELSRIKSRHIIRQFGPM